MDKPFGRSAQRRHGLDASAFNSSMSFGDLFLECPCSIAVPIKSPYKVCSTNYSKVELSANSC